MPLSGFYKHWICQKPQYKVTVKTLPSCPSFSASRHYILAPALDLVFQLTVEKQSVPLAKENLQRHFAHMTVAFELPEFVRT